LRSGARNFWQLSQPGFGGPTLANQTAHQLRRAHAFNLVLAIFTQNVHPQTITLRLFDRIVQVVAHLKILGACETALKHAILHPLTEVFENPMDTSAALIILDIV
jgi:hypothetical protein